MKNIVHTGHLFGLRARLVRGLRDTRATKRTFSMRCMIEGMYIANLE